MKQFEVKLMELIDELYKKKKKRKKPVCVCYLSAGLLGRM